MINLLGMRRPSAVTTGGLELAQPSQSALTAAWAAWLATEEQRVRRTINPRTGKPPGVMPDELGSTELADFPAEFGKLVLQEPVVKPDWMA
jgi:hypothetical protein